jgi:hypothetical protein
MILVLGAVLANGSRADAQVLNFGLTVHPEFPVGFSGSHWVLAVAESSVSLNGDADLSDVVVFTVDDASGIVTNTGWSVRKWSSAVSPLLVNPFAAYFSVSEFDQGGQDLNGDGDATDQLPIRYDLATQTASFLGFAGSVTALQDDDEVVLCRRFEEPGLDLNGDGDFLDEVVHRYDPATGMLTNLVALAMAPTTPYGLPGGDLLMFAFGEFKILPKASTTLISTGLDVSMQAPTGSLAPFRWYEGGTGIDRNGDGDLTDWYIGILDAATNTHKIGTFGTFDTGLIDLRVVNGRAVYVVAELAASLDLNGDGDEADHILSVFDFATGSSLLILDERNSSGRWLGEDALFYLGSETLRAGLGLPADLNGDGDADDYVSSVLEFSTGVTHRGRAAGSSLGAGRIVGDHVLYDVGEKEEFHTDIDANGTFVEGSSDVFGVEAIGSKHRSLYVQEGNVIVTWDPVDGPAIAAIPSALSSTARVLAYTNETYADGFDVNGDGDANDLVLMVVDLEQGLYRSVGLPVPKYLGYPHLAVATDRVGMAVEEAKFGGDLNGDGDTLDHVFHWLTIPQAWSGKVEKYGTPCPAWAGGVATLDVHGNLAENGRAVIVISGGKPGESALLLLGSGPASIPIGLACPLLLAAPILAPSGLWPLPHNGFLQGSIRVPVYVPPGLAGATGSMQAFITHSTLGIAPSNGVAFTVGP